MKIIKTARYKKIESAFEGQVYSPDIEDKWLSRDQGGRTVSPTKSHPSTNKNKARFRPSVVDKVPPE